MTHSARSIMTRSIGLATLLSSTLLGTATSANDTSLSTSTYGLPGLVDLPTARSLPDATIVGTYARFDTFNRSTLSFQISDRLTGSFRYSRLEGLESDGTDYFDRSFDVHYRFADEGKYRPSMAIGLRDIIGTGVYSSEYIVATKSVTPTIEATFGLGWGRLGGTYRDFDFGNGGNVNFENLFSGNIAPFGGVSWKATDKLTAKIEYSPDEYESALNGTVLDTQTPINIGIDYAYRKGQSVSAYYLHGDKVGLKFSFDLNINEPATTSGLDPAPLSIRPRPSRTSSPQTYSTDWFVTDTTAHEDVQAQITAELAKEGIEVHAMSMAPTRVELRISNTKYGAHPQAIGRTARMMSRLMPASVEVFDITLTAHGVPSSTTTVKRSDLEALEFAPSFVIQDRAQIGETVNTRQSALRPSDDLFPRLTWNLGPFARVNIFDPDSPVRADFGVRLKASYEFSPNLVLSGSVRQKLIGNLSSSTRDSNSTLPHVRSDVNLYDEQGASALESLTLAHYSRLGTNLYGRVTAGYLESMFGGVSGEVLWKPVDSRLALGAELNYVAQRDYDQLLGFQDYDILMGHVSGYYRFDNGYHAQLDVGRYLAGDYGATISLNREFSNGWKVGFYATATDVSADDFGEGSFDKGITMTVPIQWASGGSTRKTSNIDLRSLARDGGARLSVDGRLYDEVRQTHTPQLEERWGRFWR